ncbi:MAG: hypothetical protein ACTSQJ_11895 [Promethearchaeota archaeon]
MKNKKIVFFKSLSLSVKSTEHWAIEILNDSKYDDNPFINKVAIQRALDKYGYQLNPFNSAIYDSVWSTPNVEGHFLAENLPEIESIVIDQVCSKEVLYNTLEKNPEITHIALSIYANGLNNALEVIESIVKDFPEKELYIGNVGVIYPHIKGKIPLKNICFGNGINWLREKFELRKYNRNDIKIPKIISPLEGLPIKINAAYIVTQIGCPFKCDFCITNKFLQYNPFSEFDKLKNLFEDILLNSKKDIFLYLCDPNAFFPEKLWNKIFDYFKSNNYNKNIFILSLASLNHLKKFDLEKIQDKSALKLLIVNFGIESVLKGGYAKNRGITNIFLEKLKNLGIISFHNFIIGFPHHNKKLIDVEINRNLEYNSCWFSVNTYKPIPTTSIYNQLKLKNQIFLKDIPPEFVYQEGYLPYKHPDLGFGFDILEYAFKGYIKCEEKVIDVYHNFSDTLLNFYSLTRSNKIKQAIKVFITMSQLSYPYFNIRMPAELSQKFKSLNNEITMKFKNLIYSK